MINVLMCGSVLSVKGGMVSVVKNYLNYKDWEDVDIRYIQEMLGHSSINVTEIYTHVAVEKQGNILKEKHPRKTMNINTHFN